MSLSSAFYLVGTGLVLFIIASAHYSDQPLVSLGSAGPNPYPYLDKVPSLQRID